jgi:hypothetical protein
LNNTSASITTIENPADVDPILIKTDLNSTNSILPSLENTGLSALTIDSEGSIWTHGLQIAFKLIDTDFATEYEAQPVLGTTDYELGSSFDIFPNPTKNNIQINFKQDGAYSLSVYNIYGQEIFRQEKLELSNTVSLAKYASGIYILKIKDVTSNTFQNVKIIKQ